MSSTGLNESLTEALLPFLQPAERAELEKLLERVRPTWAPDPDNKPQCEGYDSSADILGFGGAAGGGKTELAIGLALTRHRRSGIFRQNGTELTAIVDRIGEILGTRDGFNGQERIWRFKRRDGTPVQIELGSFPSPGEERKYQGRPHDLLVFDEAANMRESAVRFLMGWLRTTDPEQRCRVLMCFNPPTLVEGRWVVEFFAPWLDDRHGNPAAPGELRWFATIDGKDREVKGPEPFEHKRETIRPMSRTFIPSRVTDNKYLAGTGYVTKLQAMKEPFRSMFLYGDFRAGTEDDPFQVIPTAWVERAMELWEKPDVLAPMDSIGVDVAMGGDDNTVIARRHGMWFDEPIVYTGRECQDGSTVAGYVAAALRNRAVIHVDAFGVGSRPLVHLREMGVQALGINVGNPSGATAIGGGFGFKNLRAQLWWQMREALDPQANTGIRLPPDRRLLADLTAPKYEKRERVMKVQSREDIVKSIGRSPDFGSAYCLALMDTMKIGVARQLLRGPGQEYDPFKDL